MAHVAPYKIKIVESIVKLMEEYPIVGAINMEGMPTPQLQQMRSSLRETVVMTMTKKRLIKLALDKADGKKKGLAQLKEHLIGMPALIFTKENPFLLFKTLKKSKSAAPAKAGQTAPKDIIVPAGPTTFAPGPIIGELGSVGIKTGVENGKLVIKEDSIVAKEGDIIDIKLAGILTRLNIQPMEVGLDLVAVYEKGTIFTKKVLNIDEDKFMADLSQAASWAWNLAVDITYPVTEVLEFLISKAFKESKAVALEANIMCDAVIEELVMKAERQMNALNSQLDIKIESPKEEAPKPEEKPAEEAKEEAKPEDKKEETKEEPAPAEKKTAEVAKPKVSESESSDKTITEKKASEEAKKE